MCIERSIAENPSVHNARLGGANRAPHHQNKNRSSPNASLVIDLQLVRKSLFFR